MITDYSSLKTQVADHLDRDDLTSVIPTLIQMAENRMILDPYQRVRDLVDRATVTISADGLALPSDLIEIDTWYHDGSLYYGDIDIVDAGTIGTLKGRLGATGVPRAAAIVAGSARFAPAPDGTYSTKMTYWRTIDALSDSNTTNWLLTAYPAIYLYGTLAEAELYLKNDERVASWRQSFESYLEALSLINQNKQFGGNLHRQIDPIG